MLAVVIIENRQENIQKIIDNHFAFLPKKFTIYKNETINSIKEYNQLLTSTNFWVNFLEFDRVLIIQHDSALLRKGLEDFYKWDYIGAPWMFQDYGGNGGLSLRNPKLMYKICLEKKYSSIIYGNEDLYFSHYVMHYGNLAPREECEKFSCESIFKLGTLGYHAIDKYLTEDECKQIKTQYNEK